MIPLFCHARALRTLSSALRNISPSRVRNLEDEVENVAETDVVASRGAAGSSSSNETQSGAAPDPHLPRIRIRQQYVQAHVTAPLDRYDAFHMRRIKFQGGRIVALGVEAVQALAEAFRPEAAFAPETCGSRQLYFLSSQWAASAVQQVVAGLPTVARGPENARVI